VVSEVKVLKALLCSFLENNLLFITVERRWTGLQLRCYGSPWKGGEWPCWVLLL